MSKHTSGKWWYTGHEVVRMGEQIKICSRVSGRTPEEAQANGLLLAAAPELLEVLEQIVGQEKPNRYGYDAAGIALDDNWRAKARAALAKAKGA